ncbi:hypothetical protein Patl1_37228 [Pistacia atlantica]|nr:hypothetical protein Patl1_37228 [Pistacia atlantica]
MRVVKQKIKEAEENVKKLKEALRGDRKRVVNAQDLDKCKPRLIRKQKMRRSKQLKRLLSTQNDLHGEAFKTVCNGGKHVEELACESEKIFEDVEELDAAIKQQEDKGNFEFSSEVDSGKNMEETRQPSIFQAEEETTEIYNDIKTNQNT